MFLNLKKIHKRKLNIYFTINTLVIMETELQLTNLTENSWYYNTKLPNDICISVNEYMQLWSMKPNFKNKIKLFGKTCTIPREQMVYGIHDYSYSGTTFHTQDTPPILQKYIDWVNQFEKIII